MRPRWVVVVMLACFCALFLVTAQAIAMALIGALGSAPISEPWDGHRRVWPRPDPVRRKGPEKWALRFRHERQLVDNLRRRLRRQRYVVLHQPSVVEAIDLAAATYGHGDELWRKAACESHMNPGARNLSSAASGLYQFLPGTFASTPYGRFSIYSPYARFGGWLMHAHGRSGAGRAGERGDVCWI
jgi:hypothetical protein